LQEWRDKKGDGKELNGRPKLETLADNAANHCNYWEYLRELREYGE
jgi:hypothetical protein